MPFVAVVAIQARSGKRHKSNSTATTRSRWRRRRPCSVCLRCLKSAGEASGPGSCRPTRQPNALAGGRGVGALGGRRLTYGFSKASCTERYMALPSDDAFQDAANKRRVCFRIFRSAGTRRNGKGYAFVPILHLSKRRLRGSRWRDQRDERRRDNGRRLHDYRPECGHYARDVGMHVDFRKHSAV